MKTILPFLAIFMALHTTALAGTLAAENGAEFGLNQASPNQMATHLLGTKLMKQSLRSVEVKYAFGAQGGSIATVFMVDPRNGLPKYFPKNAIIRNCVIDVLTAPVGAGATIAFSSGQAAGDLLGATAITSLGLGLHACIPVGSAATSVKLNSDVQPTISVATAALTAGAINVIIDYSLSL